MRHRERAYRVDGLLQPLADMQLRRHWRTMVAQELVEQAHDAGVVVAVGLPDGEELAQVDIRRIVLEGRARDVIELPQPAGLHQHLAWPRGVPQRDALA